MTCTSHQIDARARAAESNMEDPETVLAVRLSLALIYEHFLSSDGGNPHFFWKMDRLKPRSVFASFFHFVGSDPVETFKSVAKLDLLTLLHTADDVLPLNSLQGEARWEWWADCACAFMERRAREQTTFLPKDTYVNRIYHQIEKMRRAKEQGASAVAQELLDDVEFAAGLDLWALHTGYYE